MNTIRILRRMKYVKVLVLETNSAVSGCLHLFGKRCSVPEQCGYTVFSNFTVKGHFQVKYIVSQKKCGTGDFFS